MAELSDEDKYINDWVRTMIVIWREKIERLKIMDTGRLHQSLMETVTDAADTRLIDFKFVRYGIYQAFGVGNGYTPGNDGDLAFLDPEYRREHKLGKPRQRRDWIFKKLCGSRFRMMEALARITGERAVQVICDALDDVRATMR